MAGRIEIGSFKMEWGAQKSVGPTYDLKGTEARTNFTGYLDNFTDEPVSERRSLGLPTVYTCLDVLSQTTAALPINILIEENGQKRVQTDHSAYYPLAHEPNDYMSSANMILTSMIHSKGWGNSVIGINRDSRLRPYSFDLVCPGEWHVTKVNGRAYYKINGLEYSSRDVLHFRWFSLDGLCGVSPIMMNKMTMGKAFKQNRYSAMALGDRAPGHLGYEGNLTATQIAQNQKNWKENRNEGNIPVLSGNWKYQTHLIPPGDAEYIETANLTDQQICGIFRVPPAFVQNFQRMTWNNAEQVDLIFAKHTMTAICTVIEKECNMKLFTEKEKKNHSVKLNMNGLLRGDSKARAEFYTAMRNIGAMNGNEIRDKEDLNNYEGGEIFTMQAANIPIDQLREFYSNKVATSGGNQQNGKEKVNGFHHEHN